MPLVWEDEVTEFRPTCAPDEWYKLRRLLSHDLKAARRAAQTVDDNGLLRFDLATFDSVRTFRAITEWSHTHAGQPTPITPENFDLLDAPSYQELVAEVSRISPLSARKTEANS